jgi:hypothetical protein
MKKYTRYIDRVTVKGSTDPIGLYTIDMDVSNCPPSKIDDLNKNDKQEAMSFKKEMMKEYFDFENLPDEEQFDAESYINENKDLRMIMSNWNENF